MDNVDLTDPIISRFDILSVVRDEVDYYQDRALATFVINSHIKSHPDGHESIEDLESTLLDVEGIIEKEDELISQETLKKYIIYSKKYVHPKLTNVDKEKISDFYSCIRKYSASIGGISIGIRHIESMLRMSEAHAKMHLRDYVRADDVDLAIKMLLESFLQSQKTSIASALRPKLSKYLSQSKDDFELLFHILKQMIREKARYKKLVEETDQAVIDVDIPKEQFLMETKDIPHDTVDRFLNSAQFKREYIYEDGKILAKAV